MSSTEPKQFDAFLSYNSHDRLAVEELFKRLKNEKMAPYFEGRELAPGVEIQPVLAKGLNESKTCVVFLGPNGLGPWQKQELQVAIDKRARDEAFHVIPVLLPGAERPRRGDVAHLEFLINGSWVEFLKTLDDERAFRNLVWGITGTKPTDPDEPYEKGVCPYRGLEAFQPEDARFFFGRDNLTGWLISALRREVRAKQGVRFLGVLGPSGSGKSSVVLAGLAPKLKTGAIDGSEHWPIAILRPGDDPLKNLAASVHRRLLPAGESPDVGKVLKLIDNLRADARTLDLVVQMALDSRAADVRLAVVVDQFEEVFTQRPQDEQARKRFEQDREIFFANLLQAAATPDGRITVVLTMRSDFLSACAPFPQLAAVLSAHQELVGPMTAAELREAIEQPAFRVGCEPESGLTERLLADVKNQRGALPLLQFALTEIWKKRNVRKLTLQAYTELGKDDKGEQRGIEGILEHRANEIYRNLKAEEQELCRRLFVRLVQPGEGTEDTKRRASYREILPDDAARAEAVKSLVRTLADRDARLITTEGTETADGVVEVAHEALIRGWTQLRRWVDAERAGLRTQRRLTEAAQEWAAATPEYKADYLYSGAPLAVCREWVKTHHDELSAIEAAFLAASEKTAKDELEAERKRAQEAEAREQEAKTSAERQNRLRRRWVVTAIAACLFALSAGGLAWLADERRTVAEKATGEAKDQTKRADKATKYAKSSEQKAKDEARTANYAIYVTRADVTQSAWERGRIDHLRTVLGERQRDEQLPGSSPRGFDWYYWHYQANRELEILPRQDYEMQAVAADADGMLFSAAHQYESDVQIKQWKLGRPSFVRAKHDFLATDKNQFTRLAFSPNADALALVNMKQNDRGWSAHLSVCATASGETHLVGDLEEKPVAVAVSSSEGRRRIVVGGECLVVFSEQGNRNKYEQACLKPGSGVKIGVKTTALAISATGDQLAAAWPVTPHSAIFVWKSKVGAAPEMPACSFDHPDPLVNVLTFSSNGMLLAGGGNRGTVVLWNGSKPSELRDPGPSFSVSSIAFSKDDSLLAVGGDDNAIRLFDIASGQLLDTFKGHNGSVRGVVFSDERTLASVSQDKTIRLWDVSLQCQSVCRQEHKHKGRVTALAWDAPERARLATASEDRTIRVWDATSGNLLHTLCDTHADGAFRSVAIARDGTIAASGNFASVYRWDSKYNKLATLPTVAHVEALAFSPATTPDPLLAAGDLKGNISLWQGETELEQKPEKHCDIIMALSFSPDGRFLASASKVDGVRLFDSRRQYDKVGEWKPEEKQRIWSIAWSPNSELLAVGSEGHSAVVLKRSDDGQLSKIDWFPKENEGSQEGHSKAVEGVAFSVDMRMLASASEDGTIKLWGIAEPTSFAHSTLKGHFTEVTTLAFSFVENRYSILASGDKDGFVRFWRATPQGNP